MAAVTNATTVNNATGLSTTTSGTGQTSAQDQSDRFLKLLVAQLNNQDPMNPMDNAQMTSQMAQINTVSGITQLNETMKSMSTQFAAMQVLQGASMVGRNVVATGNTMSVNNGVGTAAVNLDSDASNVNVQVVSPGGQVVDQFSLGAMTAGTHPFQWDASKYSGSGTPTFNVTATQGSQAVTATPLVFDTVSAVGTDASGAMNLTLQSGTSIAYSAIKSLM